MAYSCSLKGIMENRGRAERRVLAIGFEDEGRRRSGCGGWRCFPAAKSDLFRPRGSGHPIKLLNKKFVIIYPSQLQLCAGEFAYGEENFSAIKWYQAHQTS
jgi:hypothetical protein